MSISRVSTASLYEQNLLNIGQTQTELSKLNQQISSGNKANTWDELNGTVERVSGFQTKISNIDNYTANNTSIKSRLNTMDQSVSQLQDIAQQFASLISQRRSNTTSGADVNFSQQANSLLDQISQDLNISVAGRYLFAGSKTDTQPVTQPMPPINTAGTSDANYYKGDSEELSARISDTQDVKYGVTANNPAFQDLIGSIRTALAGNSGNDDALFSRSVDMINSAVKGLADVKTGIDTNITNIETVTDQQASLKLYWQQALADDTSTDIAAATIQLNADQTTLQATFQAFAGLSKLKLTDYL